MDETAVGERWRRTWELGGFPAPAELLAELVVRYREPHRAYHDLAHVLACLELAATVRGQLESPFAVELALWYHDAVYEPRAADNEARSAELAASALAFLAGPTLASVRELILATRHDGQGAGGDAALVVDIDLAIVGAPADRFDAYEAGIRREYRWVPGPIFRRKRRELLRSFLDRPSIYHTPYFQERFEAAAKANLARSLERLS